MTRKDERVTVVDRLARAAMRQSWRRGVVGGSSAWTVLGGLALIGYLGRRAVRRDVDVVFSEELAPGQSIRITHEPRP
ncbi:MAG TPA: hypothetical protein VFN68_12710 [Acidimicrobiales bacterium]|nr:hypothetical protein [Acidimicrobiales bacterium]